jgi:hypothetical protein
MRKVLLFVSVAVALCFALGTVYGAAKSRKDKSAAGTKAMGVVVSAIEEKGEKVLEIKAGKKGEEKNMKFVVTDETKILEKTAVVKFADLKEGQHVAVTYTEKDGKMTATEILVVVPKREKKAG